MQSLVCSQVALRAYACLGQGNGQGRADAVVDDTAQVIHAKDVIRKGSAGGVGIVAGPGRSGCAWVAKAENLERFEQGWEGNLESGRRIEGFER